MRLIDADSLDETITRLNEQDWGITRNEYKLIDRVIFEMPTVDVLDKIRAEIEERKVHEELGDVFKAHNVAIDGVLQIIDRYITETKAT